METYEYAGGLAIDTDQGEKIVLRRWSDFTRSGTPGMAIGFATPASSSGYWWQPLVLDVRGRTQKARLLPYVEVLYEAGKAAGIILSEYETLERTAF